MGAALTLLVHDESLRLRMGEAGRSRAREHFAWPRVIRAYEQLWRDQEAERSARFARHADCQSARWSRSAGPAAYPAPERTFAGYPTRRLSDIDRVVPGPAASEQLDVLLVMPLTHHAAGRRVPDAGLLRDALAEAPCSVEDLDRFWSKAGIEHGLGRATLAWMLKYDLFRAVWDDHPEGGLH
jgi:hypothetical protein